MGTLTCCSEAFAICRDQTNTDAYTLVGGYFNQAYYPSRRSMFTPLHMAVSLPAEQLLIARIDRRVILQQEGAVQAVFLHQRHFQSYYRNSVSA